MTVAVVFEKIGTGFLILDGKFKTVFIGMMGDSHAAPVGTAPGNAAQPFKSLGLLKQGCTPGPQMFKVETILPDEVGIYTLNPAGQIQKVV